MERLAVPEGHRAAGPLLARVAGAGQAPVTLLDPAALAEAAAGAIHPG